MEDKRTKGTGKRVKLVPFTEEHLNDPKYLSWLKDYEVMRYIGRPEYFKPFEFKMVQDYIESLWQNEYVTFFAVLTQEGTFIGTAKINYLDAQGFETKTADIGIMIGNRNEWGKGYASDAIKAACAYAFDTLGARKLVAGCNAKNGAVVRIFEKAGFKEEGRIRKKLFCEDEWCDHILLGCFKEEFENA